MKKVIFSTIILLTFLGQHRANSQGCSDSGFCTMGALKPDQPFIKKMFIRLNSIEVTQHLGHTKYGDWIHSSFLDANVGLGRKTNLQVRFPAYTVINGNMPTSKGWGDLFINLSRNVLTQDNFYVNVTSGVKLYTSLANKHSVDGHPMPLYQQTSYGSNDINFGASLLSRQWMFAVGYQRALNQVKNEFTHDSWTGSPLHDVVQVYDESAGLKRGDDLMFRVERNFRLSRFNFYMGILNLWRLNRDQTLTAEGELKSIEGSQGLASNVLAGVGYQFNASMGVRLLVSAKIKERKSNPDGLARDFISQVAYIIRF
jgi:hypothetical protein